MGSSGGDSGYLKQWDDEELIRCGAIYTNVQSNPTLSNPIHPIFSNFIPPPDDPHLLQELTYPLRLATLLLQSAGLPWLSEFVITDIFSPTYPGYDPSSQTPNVIVRHHNHKSSPEQQKREWINLAHQTLLSSISPQEIQWRLDPDILPQNGWVGYTARQQHPLLSGIDLARFDTPVVIKHRDLYTTHAPSCSHSSHSSHDNDSHSDSEKRHLTILVMTQYALHLRHLPTGSEEWLFTAFMCANTLLHELGHAVYWRDKRAMNKRMTEPYFGADLEMELGDSFVSSIFGGWVPVPVEVEGPGRVGFRRSGGRFKGGLGWRQHLCFDEHGERPRWRVCYGVRVDYLAALFDMEMWRKYEHCPELLIRPWTLPESCYRNATLDLSVTEAGLHASAALPDYDQDQDGQCTWKRRPAALFRIPLYRNVVISENEALAYDKSWFTLDPPEPKAHCNKPLSTFTTTTTRLSSPVQVIRQKDISGGGYEMTFWDNDGRYAESGSVQVQVPVVPTKSNWRHNKNNNNNNFSLPRPWRHVKRRRVDEDSSGGPGRQKEVNTKAPELVDASCRISAYAKKKLANEGLALHRMQEQRVRS
ncbi:hypothetical protein QBC43DRAFT_110854 [Cladorrhinum sp. PSN259]|nr:hypothetical protein QBC43DRAFT_110854 [Cladorrhinum sp. PSN259]